MGKGDTFRLPVRTVTARDRFVLVAVFVARFRCGTTPRLPVMEGASRFSRNPEAIAQRSGSFKNAYLRIFCFRFGLKQV